MLTHCKLCLPCPDKMQTDDKETGDEIRLQLIIVTAHHECTVFFFYGCLTRRCVCRKCSYIHLANYRFVAIKELLTSAFTFAFLTNMNYLRLNSPYILACNANVLVSLCLFPPLSKQCQRRLMVNLSDSKQRSLWLECTTRRFTQADSSALP